MTKFIAKTAAFALALSVAAPALATDVDVKDEGKPLVGRDNAPSYDVDVSGEAAGPDAVQENCISVKTDGEPVVGREECEEATNFGFEGVQEPADTEIEMNEYDESVDGEPAVQ